MICFRAMFDLVAMDDENELALGSCRSACPPDCNKGWIRVLSR